VKERPYWWDTVPPDEPRDASPLPARADVAIVGGGYTGLAAALVLARRGASVVVIEQHHTGWGASSRNAGQVLTGLKLEWPAVVRRFGTARARELYAAARDALTTLETLVSAERIECAFETTGHVQCASKPAHFMAFQREQEMLARTFDHPVTLVPRRDQRSEVGSDAYHGLLVDEGSRALNPAAYVRGLAAAARRAGAALVEHTTVDALDRVGSRWRLVTPRGHVDAGEVLAATDAYTTRAIPSLQKRLVALGSYVVVTEPLDLAAARSVLPKRRMAFNSKHFLHYFRLTPDNRLLFGGRAEFWPPEAASTARAAAQLRREMAAVFPQLDARVEYSWGGNVAFARDEMPHAGRIDHLYYACGYAGHGIAMASYLGGLIGRRIAGERFDHPLLDGSLPAIPFYDGRPWFLPFLAAYYRMRDLID